MENLLCMILGHQTKGMDVGPFRKLCKRCDATVFSGPVKVQGEKYSKQLNKKAYRDGVKQRASERW